MNRNLMMSALYANIAGIYTQVSLPQCHDGLGPYLLALSKNEDTFAFHCFEILDAETFLTDPETVATTFIDIDFLFGLADTLDLCTIRHSSRDYLIWLRKVLPDLPVCRCKVRELYAAKPELAANLMFLSDSDILFPATDIVFIPDFLN